MNLQDKLKKEYQAKRDTSYFSNCKKQTHELIDGLLVSEGVSVQAIQSRVKQEDSILNNFDKKSLYKGKTVDGLKDISDLIGLRVITYLSDDIDKVVNLIKREFSVVEWDPKTSANQYNAIHLVVKMSDSRKHLPEYKLFGDQKIEIQVTTAFYHGWNELEHDLLYKDLGGVQEISSALFERLRNKSSEVMEKYLLPAQQIWDSMTTEYNQIVDGARTVSIQNLENISKLNNNNEIYREFEKIITITKEIGVIQDLLKDKELQKLFMGLLIKIILKAKTNKVKKEKHYFGFNEGKTHYNIASQIVSFVTDIAHINLTVFTKGILDLKDMYAKDDSVASHINNSLAKLSTPYPEKKDEEIIIYFQPTNYFIELIKRMTWDKRMNNILMIKSLAEEAFQIDGQYTSSSFNEDGQVQLNMRSYSLTNSATYQEIRSFYIKLLMEMFKRTNRMDKRILVTKALLEATRRPMSGNSGELVDENKTQIENFLKKNITNGTLSLHELSIIEENYVAYIASAEFKEYFEIFIDSSIDYRNYRVLVGHERMHRSDDMSYSEIRNYRETEVIKYVKQSKKNSSDKKYWIKMIKRIIKDTGLINSGDYSAFIYFNSLLRLFTKEFPEEAISLLRKKQQSFIRENIIAGILMSKNKTAINYVRKNFSTSFDHLWSYVGGLWHLDKVSREDVDFLIKKISFLKNSTQKGQLFSFLITAINLKKISKKYFMQLMNLAANENNFTWIRHYYGEREMGGKTVISKLSKKELQKVLKKLVLNPKFDWHEEVFYGTVIKTHPDLFVEHIVERIKYRLSLKENPLLDRYEHVPHSFSHIQSLLLENEDIILKGLFELWTEIKDGESWYVANSVNHIFPNISGALEEYMVNIIKQRKVKPWKEKVAPLFTWYDGKELNEIIRLTIKYLPEDRSVWNECMIRITNPGLISGSTNEPIFANAMKNQLEKVKNWKGQNKKTRKFYAILKKDTEKRIKNEVHKHIKEQESDRYKYE